MPEQSTAMLRNLERMRMAVTEWMIKEDMLGDAFFIDIEEWQARKESYPVEPGTFDIMSGPNSADLKTVTLTVS